MLGSLAKFRMGAVLIVGLFAGLAVVPPAEASQLAANAAPPAAISHAAASVGMTTPLPTLEIVSAPATYTPGLAFTVKATTSYSATAAYPLYVVDNTTGTVLKTCTAYTFCAVPVTLVDAEIHEFVARQATSESAAVAVAAKNLVLTLTASVEQLSAGSTYTLYVGSNFDLDKVDSKWFGTAPGLVDI